MAKRSTSRDVLDRRLVDTDNNLPTFPSHYEALRGHWPASLPWYRTFSR